MLLQALLVSGACADRAVVVSEPYADDVCTSDSFCVGRSGRDDGFYKFIFGFLMVYTTVVVVMVCWLPRYFRRAPVPSDEVYTDGGDSDRDYVREVVRDPSHGRGEAWTGWRFHREQCCGRGSLVSVCRPR